MASPNITLYFLQALHSIRIAWLLEELSLPYTSVFFPRKNNKAPRHFKEKSGNALGKAPVLKDDGMTVVESGAITEYLIEKDDTEQALLGGKDEAKRNKIRSSIHAAEGTFMVHALAITYARWFSPPSVKESGDLKKLEEGLAINICKDLDWLENELKREEIFGWGFSECCGYDVLFSVQFIFVRDLNGGRTLAEWPGVEKWVRACEGTGTWKRAIEKTGHHM